MEAIFSSETSGSLRTTRHYNPEYCGLQRGGNVIVKKWYNAGEDKLVCLVSMSVGRQETPSYNFPFLLSLEEFLTITYHACAMEML
jgi:hypothetical protein